MSTKKSYLIDLQVAGAGAAQAALNGVENNLKGIAKSAAAMGAAYLSVSGVTQLLRHSVDQAIAAESAQKKLTVAIGRQSTALLEFASARQRATRFDDDGTVAAMAAIGAFTAEEKTIKRLTIAAQDLAEAKGMDLTSAAELVAKSVFGATNALGRYGVEANAAAGSTERLEQITRGIAELWGGQAAAAAETLEGKVQQAKNAFDDMAQSIGEKLAPTLKGFADLVTRMLTPEDGVDGLTQASQDYRAAISHLIIEMERLGLVTNDANAQEQVRQAYQTMSVATLERMLGANREMDDELIAVIHTLEKYNSMVKEKNAAEAGGGTRSGGGGQEALRLRLETAAAYRLEAETIEVSATSMEAYNQRKLEQLDAKTREAELSAQFITLYPAEAEALGLVASAQERAAASADLLAQKRSAIVSGTGALLGSFAALNGAAKGSAQLTKRLAQGEAIINTYAAANMALRNPPGPPWTIPLMLSTIVQGLANVVQIQSQNFADGGWVRGPGGARSDAVPARLSAGERVLSAREIAAMGGRAGVDAAARGMRGTTVVNVTLSGPIDRQWWQDVALPQLQEAVRLSA